MSWGKKCTSLSFFYAMVASPGRKKMQTRHVSQQPLQRPCHGMLLVTGRLSLLNDSVLLRCPFLTYFSHFLLCGHILGPRCRQTCTTLKRGEKQKEPKPWWWDRSPIKNICRTNLGTDQTGQGSWAPLLVETADPERSQEGTTAPGPAGWFAPRWAAPWVPPAIRRADTTTAVGILQALLYSWSQWDRICKVWTK